MTKYYCDRCGKEIISKSSVMNVLFCSDKNFNEDSNFSYEICPECAVSFRHWVEDPKDFDVSSIRTKSVPSSSNESRLCDTCSKRYTCIRPVDFASCFLYTKEEKK